MNIVHKIYKNDAGWKQKIKKKVSPKNQDMNIVTLWMQIYRILEEIQI